MQEAEHISDEEESDEEDNVALEKQLAWSEHRMRELEALVDKAVSMPEHLTSQTLTHVCSASCSRHNLHRFTHGWPASTYLV